MFVRTCLFLALLALAHSQRFRRSPTAIPTSTYGTSPVPSVSSAPTWTPIASESASSSGSKSPRPSKSSIPSVSETRSARISSSPTSTARLSSEPTSSSLATTSPTFSVSVTTSTSASVTRTPSETPSISPSPCALWYKKWHPKSQACDSGGSETKDGANASSLFSMAGMGIPIGFFIAMTIGAYTFARTGRDGCICERRCDRPWMHSIALTIAFIPCFFPWILYIMYGTIEGYDQTPYKIASGVLACVWIFSVFCLTPMCIRIEECCLGLKHRYLRLRQWWIYLRVQMMIRSLPPQPVASLENISGATCGAAAPRPDLETGASSDGRLRNEERHLEAGASCNGPSKNNECSRKTGVSGERQSPDMCTICRENQGSMITLPCTHKFHTMCIDTWLSSSLEAGKRATCPICRAAMQITVGGSK